VERGVRAADTARHVGEHRLRRHEDDARLRQHRAECVASRRRRGGTGLRQGIRTNGLDDVVRRLEQGTVPLDAAAAHSAVQERPAPARGLHVRRNTEHDRRRRKSSIATGRWPATIGAIPSRSRIPGSCRSRSSGRRW
jgi:hypothetical protein